MDRQSFIDRFGGVFEHSPWVAAEAWEHGARDGTAGDLQATFNEVIESADRDRQLDLLRAHPQLACAIASGEELTGESLGEQRGAGLDRCSPAEFGEFERLNRAYTNKFGFPFIVAVKGLGRERILAIFRERLEHPPGEEFEEALRQVMRIGAARLQLIAEKGEHADGR